MVIRAATVFKSIWTGMPQAWRSPDESQRDQDVVKEAENGGCRKFIFKAECKIDEDADECDEKADQRIISHAVGHLAAHRGPVCIELREGVG